MISFSVGPYERFFFLQVEGRRSKVMICADRFNLNHRALIFLFLLFGIPKLSWPGTLEDSAKELARTIAAALPAQAMISCEIRNISSLRPDEVARIEQALKAELQDRGVRVSATGNPSSNVVLNFSENWKEFVWTGEIRRQDAMTAVLLAVPRGGERRFSSNAMHITVRGEKFWEGSERILDADRASTSSGKSWLVLLRPAALSILDLQTGSTNKIDFANFALESPSSREPWGKVGASPASGVIWFEVPSHVCNIDLEALAAPDCLSGVELNKPISGRFSIMLDLGPSGPPPPGKGIELVITPVCGGTDQFLATSARDDTQTDSLQVFQTEPNGPVAMSAELDFPGPILALHSALDAPRAIVRNLSTGNYEAYRLAISCGE